MTYSQWIISEKNDLSQANPILTIGKCRYRIYGVCVLKTSSDMNIIPEKTVLGGNSNEKETCNGTYGYGTYSNDALCMR